MCGILTYINAPASRLPQLVSSGLHEQHRRGMDGAGYVLVLHSAPQSPIVKRFLSPFHALSQLSRDIDSIGRNERRVSLAFHHRLPTSTANVEQCNHPIQSGRSFLIHNGIISNSWTLKNEHERRGIVYATKHKDRFNDSEALAHEWTIALASPRKKRKGSRYHIKAYGSFAFVRYDIERKAFMYGRNSGNPLECAKLDDGTLCFVSQADHQLAPIGEWVSLDAGSLHVLRVPSLAHEVYKFSHALPPPPPPVRTYKAKNHAPLPSYSGKGFSFENWEDWDSCSDAALMSSQRIDETTTMFKAEADNYIPAKYRVQSKTKVKHNGWLFVPTKKHG